MTFQRAVEYLDSYINYEKVSVLKKRRSFNLRRVRYLLKRLGCPHQAYPSVLIAGTKGKGSTAATLKSVLRAHGLRVGLYTSPHLSSIRERICVNNTQISEKEFAACITQLKKHILSDSFFKSELHRPTYFEILTVAAFMFFQKQKIDIAVVEVGLGGRLDATNVLQPLISVITRIGLDHQMFLGRTLPAIAREKAAIIKKNQWAVIAPQVPVVQKVIQDRVQCVHACLHSGMNQAKLIAHDLVGVRFSWRHFQKLSLPLVGAHQFENATTALEATYLLQRLGICRLQRHCIEKGLKEVTWPGRLEIIQKKSNCFVLDGAHNQESMHVLWKSMRHLFSKKPILILAFSSDKLNRAIVGAVQKISQSIIVTQTKHARAVPALQLKRYIMQALPNTVLAPTVPKAIEKAIQMNHNGNPILVTGSLFAVAEAREVLFT